MSALPPKSPATAAPFSDAFGYRVLGFDKKSGDRLEMLRLRPQLASSAPFEAALRERQRRLSDFRHPAFARVRQIDRPAGQSAALAVVSNHFEGLRLSDLGSALGLGSKDRVRLRVTLEADDAASLYRSLPPDVGLVVIGEWTR